MAVRFAVLGDIHYTNERFHRREGGDDDIARYAEARRTYYGALIEEIRAARPDFVVQLGDLLQGSWDQPDQAGQELREALEWLGTVGCPCYAIRGNHDDRGPAARACDAALAPYLAGLPVERRENFSYEFAAGGARFVFLDCREFVERPETRRWLEDLPRRAAGAERLFVFAHEPLFPVARIYFSNPRFVQTLRAVLANCAVSGYFCGHTHNQAVAFHPALARDGLLQVKTSVVGVLGSDPLPLEQTRTLLLPPEARYLGGYLEDTLPSWFLVEADANAVRLTWHAIAGGIEGILQWDRPGDAAWVQAPAFRPLPAVSDGELSGVKSARIRMAFHGSLGPGKRVRLNGAIVGDAPPGGSFAPRNGLELQGEQCKLLRRENTIALENGPGEKLCWGGVYIEAETHAGRRIRTACADRVFDAGYTPDGNGATPNVVRRRPGETLGPVTVTFQTSPE